MKDEGLTDEEMGITPEADEGLTDEEMGLPAAEGKPKGHGALTTFAANAADGASVIGLPRALAAGEAFMESQLRGPEKRPGLKDNYDRKVKENQPIADGMSEDFDEHPVAAMAGQLSTALVPGPKLGLVKGAAGIAGKLATKYPKLAKLLQVGVRGATQGALHGAAAGGSDTSGGDLEGTAKDALTGAAFGTGAGLAGAAGGKLIEEMGDMAGRKLRGMTLTKAKSIIGKYRQQKGEAGNALDRLEIMDQLGKAGAAAPPGLPQSAAKRMLQKRPQLVQPLRDARVGNADKDFEAYERNIRKFGPRGVPSMKRGAGGAPGQAMQMAEKELNKEAGGVLKNLLVRGAGAYVGYKGGEMVGEATGINPQSTAILGMLAGGRGGNYFLQRKILGSILDHPKVLAKASQHIPGLGRALQRGGKAMAETVLGSYLRKEGNREKLARDLKEEGDEGDDFEPISHEDGGGGGSGEGGGGGGGKDFLWKQEKDPDAWKKAPKPETKTLQLDETEEEERKRLKKNTAPTGGDV